MGNRGRSRCQGIHFQERPKRFLLAVALRAGRAALRADALELIPAGWVDIAERPLTKKEQSRAYRTCLAGLPILNGTSSIGLIPSPYAVF